MGSSGLVPKIKDGDWTSVRQAIAKLSVKVGPTSEPTFAGLTLSGLTASRLIWGDANKTLASKDLIDLVAGTADEINVADDGSGGVTIGIVDPLIVAKGGTGATTFTGNGILLGQGDDPIADTNALTDGQLLIGDTGSPPTPATLTGTANQVIITGGAGSITLSTPQDIHTTANVSFNSVSASLISSLAYYASVGTVGVPTYTFTGRTTTGLWSSAADILNVSCAGAEVLELDAAEATFAIPVRTTDITMAGLFTNTLAAGDAQGLLIDGDTNARTYAGAAETVAEINRTVNGDSSTINNYALLSNALSFNYDYTGLTNLEKSIVAHNNLITVDSDIEYTGGFGTGTISFAGMLNNLISTASAELKSASAKDMIVNYYGANCNALNRVTYNITSGSITHNIIGGKFSTTANLPPVTAGIPVVNYYGGYFDAAGAADGTSTAYGGYFTAAGADTNYGIYVATGITHLGGAANYTQISATGDITQVGTGRTLESEKYKNTAIGGRAIKLTNTTGAVTVAGQLVQADPATDDAATLATADELEIIGVFLDSGVADDAEAWVVISGIADVAMEDNTLAAHGNWVRSSITEIGYSDATNADAPQPINQTHFAEVGHCIESVAAGGAGTHILARCVLHFN